MKCSFEEQINRQSSHKRRRKFKRITEVVYLLESSYQIPGTTFLGFPIDDCSNRVPAWKVKKEYKYKQRIKQL